MYLGHWISLDTLDLGKSQNTNLQEGGGGAHKHLFDSHAHPRTNFHRPKKEDDSKFKPKKTEQCNVCQSLNKYEKPL